MCVAYMCAFVLAVKVFAIGRRFARTQAHKPHDRDAGSRPLLLGSLPCFFRFPASHTLTLCVYVYTCILLWREERAQTRTRTCHCLCIMGVLESVRLLIVTTPLSLFFSCVSFLLTLL